jgi:tetratricopeptide (TPR) repeat protein
MQSRFTRTVVLVVGLAVATTACGRYSWSSLVSAKAFKDGIAAYQKADYRTAIEEFEASVSSNPDFQFAGFAFFYLGNSYDNLYRPARKGEPENDANLTKAVEHYRTAIEKLATSDMPQAPEFHKRSYEYLISAYGSDKLDDFSMAEPIAKELISIEPNEPTNYQALGRLYEDQGQYEQAEAMYMQAIQVRPDDPAGYQLLAGYYNRQGEFDKTMEAFRKRAEMEPNNPEAWHTIGTYNYDKVYRDKSLSREEALKYVQEGLEAEDRSIELNADYYEAVTFKGLLLRQQALLERNPARQQALIEQADQLQARAEEIQAKQAGAAAAAN